MGRYDRISVMTSNGFVQPSRIYIKKPNGEWLDLGTNNSEVQDTLEVYKTATHHVPATLKLKWIQETEYTGDPYTTSRFQLKDRDAYCFSPSKGPDSNGNYYYSCDCWFRVTMRKTADVDQMVFHTYNGTQHFLKIIWKASGVLEISTSLNGRVSTFSTTNAVTKDQWVYLDFYAPRKLSKDKYIQVTFNGVITKSSNFKTFLGINYNNYIGDTYVQFKDGISVQMYNRPDYTTRRVDFNIKDGGSETDKHTAFSRANLPVVVTKAIWV